MRAICPSSILTVPRVPRKSLSTGNCWKLLWNSFGYSGKCRWGLLKGSQFNFKHQLQVITACDHNYHHIHCLCQTSDCCLQVCTGSFFCFHQTVELAIPWQYRWKNQTQSLKKSSGNFVALNEQVGISLGYTGYNKNLPLWRAVHIVWQLVSSKLVILASNPNPMMFIKTFNHEDI